MSNCSVWLTYFGHVKNKQSALFLGKDNEIYFGEHLYTRRVFNLTLLNSDTTLFILVIGRKHP